MNDLESELLIFQSILLIWLFNLINHFCARMRVAVDFRWASVPQHKCPGYLVFRLSNEWSGCRSASTL